MYDALIDSAVADVGPDAWVEEELEAVRGGRLVRAAHVLDRHIAVEFVDRPQPRRIDEDLRAPEDDLE